MHPVTVKKPWGSFTQFTNNEPSTVKLLFINKGEELSLQYHSNRTEFWRILKGQPEIMIGEKTLKPGEGKELTVKPLVKHRVSAPVDDVVILEISTGQFDEDDVVRVEDKYNRV